MDKCNHYITKACYKNGVLKGFYCQKCGKFLNKYEVYPYLKNRNNMKRTTKLSTFIAIIFIIMIFAQQFQINNLKQNQKEITKVNDGIIELLKDKNELEKGLNEVDSGIIEVIEALNQENEMISRFIINDIAEKTDRECLNDDDINFLNRTPRITDEEMNAIFKMDLNNKCY